MEKFGGIERDSKWVNENYMKIPPTLSSVIKEAIMDYAKKYEKSEYLPQKELNNLRRWKLACAIDDEIDDELL